MPMTGNENPLFEGPYQEEDEEKKATSGEKNKVELGAGGPREAEWRFGEWQRFPFGKKEGC